MLLALPALASAEVIEIGKIDSQVKPGCPDKPCYAVSRTTGYQAKVGTTRGLMVVPKDGRIVAWTLALGKPGKKQTEFFNSKLGGEAPAQLTILDPKRKLRSRAVAQGEVVKLQPYFGRTSQFPLAQVDPGQEGSGHRDQRADLGACARNRPWQRHFLAREPREGRVRGHAGPDGAAPAQPARAVLLPVPDRAPDLQRDAGHEAAEQQKAKK